MTVEVSSLCMGLARIIDVSPSVPIRECRLDGVLGSGNVFDAAADAGVSERVGGGWGYVTGCTEKADPKTEVPFDAVA